MKEVLVCFVLVIAAPLSFGHVILTGLESVEQDPKSDVIEVGNDTAKEIYTCPIYPRPIDCEEVLKSGNRRSGVYTIWPKSRLIKCQTLRVYCDMETDGGGWTVIQRRGNFSNREDYFNRNWHEYQNGFGKLRNEFWLGNDNIAALTNQGTYSVRFDMNHRNGTHKFALYDSFWIESEQQNYKLHLNRYIGGEAHNALAPHHLRAFYTKDRPNIPDDVKKDGKRPAGGWWFNIFPSSNLNGLNKKSDFKGHDGIIWNTYGGYQNSMAATEIKLRSVNF